MNTMEKRVLVVDDKEINRQTAMLLEQSGYKADIAADVLSAVKTLGAGEYFKDPAEANHFALLTDLMMPLGGADYELVGMNPDYDRQKEKATGFGLMLYAAKIGVPNIAVLTDMNHHSNSYGALFDLLYAKDMRHSARPVFRINDSKVMLFDERDLHDTLYQQPDGSFSDNYYSGAQCGKNWPRALETLLGAK
jgi:CheY-like chemotaxis protein